MLAVLGTAGTLMGAGILLPVIMALMGEMGGASDKPEQGELDIG